MGKNKRKDTLADPTRRQFLSMLGKSAGAPFLLKPSQVLVTGLVEGIISQAAAQTATVAPRNYVFIGMGGGPPRWYFDLPLTPTGTESFIANKHVTNRFTDMGTKYGAPIYQTTPITQNGVTLQMPYLWANTIPLASGGSAPMGGLLANMLIMRGITMQADGHNNNFIKQIRPANSSPSLDGFVADNAAAPVPAVGLQSGPYEAYSSGKGIGQTVVTGFYSGSNPLGEILSPFNRSGDGLGSTYLTRRASMELVMNQALAALAAYSKTTQPGAENLFTIRNSAESLLKSALGNLQTSFQTLYTKYHNLIVACASQRMLGVTDKPVYFADIPTPANQTSESDGSYLRNTNFADMINTTTDIYELAENFAVAEYLIKNKYSNTVTFGFGGIHGQTYTLSSGTTTNTYWGQDEHSGGVYPSLILNSFFYRAFAACLNEFITVLKGNNLFNETVIQLGAEFSRSPRGDQSGSDHGWMANVVSLWSGAIDKPMVLGNIYADSTKSPETGGDLSYPGTWGVSYPVTVDGVSQRLNMGHVTSTVAKLLRVNAPLPNNGSLVIEGATGLTATVESAKNV